MRVLYLQMLPPPVQLRVVGKEEGVKLLDRAGQYDLQHFDPFALSARTV